MKDFAASESIAAEQAVLGAILLDNAAHSLVADVLNGEHFFDPFHAELFDRMSRRIASAHAVSVAAMALDLADHPSLKELGGPGYLARMAGNAPGKSQLREYAGIIIEAACRRRLQESAQEAQVAISEGQDSLSVKARLLEALQALPEPAGGESSYSLAAAIEEAADHAVRAYQGETSFLPTGIDTLDRVIRGLAAGDMCLVAGATSMGKTSLALDIANNVARLEGHGVVFVSLEMTRQELATRIVSARARVPYSDLRDAANMQEAEFRRWIEATAPASQANLRIVPRHIRDVPSIYAAAKRASLDFPARKPSLLVVDYAQLVRGQGKGRYEQMTDVSISLKHLAGLLECPIMPLCQLSRDIGSRDDKRPQLSDIKETGQFENDADQVVFCHREHYWLQRQGPQPDRKGEITLEQQDKWEADCKRWQGIMELIVRKNRHGRLATAEVGFHEPTMRFWKLEDTR